MVPYFRKDALGNVVSAIQTGEPEVEGHRRQVIFTSLGLKPDVLPFCLFHDEARGFDLPIETRGTLRFTIKSRLRRNADGPTGEQYAELVLIDFIPDSL